VFFQMSDVNADVLNGGVAGVVYKNACNEFAGKNGLTTAVRRHGKTPLNPFQFACLLGF
jgi:hypothetical protein